MPCRPCATACSTTRWAPSRTPPPFCLRRDCDAYDAVADHLIVVDHDVSDGPDGVVGTYRMVQREGAAIVGRFYSAAEYDIAPHY